MDSKPETLRKDFSPPFKVPVLDTDTRCFWPRSKVVYANVFEDEEEEDERCYNEIKYQPAVERRRERQRLQSILIQFCLTVKNDCHNI